MRSWVGRRLAASVLALAALVPLAAAPPAAASVALPWGKSGYVVSTIGGSVNAIGVRLAMYQFRSTGVVTQQYWSWRQDAISGKGNVSWTKPPSGYTTTGCRRECPIRAPYGFQSGGWGHSASGRFSMSDSVLTITWSWGSVEKWRLIGTRPGVVGIRQVTTNATAHGWGLGSNAPLNKAVDARTIYGTGYLRGPWAENAYGRPTTFSRIGFNPVNHTLCPNGLCIQGNDVTAADKRTWYSSYYAANPAKDGRKVFHNHQVGAVQQTESPGSLCISGGGGHTEAMLQALDDSGHLVGLVGVEASLNQRKPAQAIVTAFAMAKGQYVLQGTPLLS
ncbi:MAG: hypothetical protein WAL50_08150 [Kineosporiaceae bacterium]